MYMFLVRDGRKKQARSNKQTRQSNTALVHVQYNRVNIFVNTWTLVSCTIIVGLHVHVYTVFM